jgi:predicted dehydrogenase
MIRLAMCGTDEATARYWAARLKGAVLAPLEEADAVIAESWPAGIDTALAALLAGRHVLLPAGACDSVESLDSLIAAAKRGGVRLGVANPERYIPSRRLIKEQLDSGKLGDVGLVRIHRWETSPGQFDDPAKLPLGWPLDLNLALWLAGMRPTTVFAMGRADATDFMQIHLGFANGAMALIDYTPRLPEGEAYRSLSVIGSKGSASADDLHNLQLLNQGYVVRTIRTDEIRPLTVIRIVQEFVDCLASGRDPTESATCWRTSLEIAAAVRKSLSWRQAVSVKGN